MFAIVPSEYTLCFGDVPLQGCYCGGTGKRMTAPAKGRWHGSIYLTRIVFEKSLTDPVPQKMILCHHWYSCATISNRVKCRPAALPPVTRRIASINGCLQDPYFFQPGFAFHSGLTDSGVCDVHNGISMMATFADSDRLRELSKAFDSRIANVTTAGHIKGTGHSHTKSFWISVRDGSLRNEVPNLPRRKGRASIALNEHMAYYNVRTNNVAVTAGQEVVIKVRPVVHATTQSFRSLPVEHRKCLYPDVRKCFYRRRSCRSTSDHFLPVSAQAFRSMLP